MKKILIMGLPGSGKTTLASELVPLIKAKWINNDKVRKDANDWDFSEAGRVRQAKRMADLAEKYKQEGSFVVCDFKLWCSETIGTCCKSGFKCWRKWIICIRSTRSTIRVVC